MHADLALHQPDQRLAQGQPDASANARAKAIEALKAKAKAPVDAPVTPAEATTPAAAAQAQAKIFWSLDRDLKALGDFIQRYLSAQHRWLSPIFIAGESYGGFRGPRLAYTLQTDLGVAVKGVVLVSPLLTSVVVRTLAWVVLLSQRGILNQAFTGVGLPPICSNRPS